jgi:hypothetical protein
MGASRYNEKERNLRTPPALGRLGGILEVRPRHAHRSRLSHVAQASLRRLGTATEIRSLNFLLYVKTTYLVINNNPFDQTPMKPLECAWLLLTVLLNLNIGINFSLRNPLPSLQLM